MRRYIGRVTKVGRQNLYELPDKIEHAGYRTQRRAEIDKSFIAHVGLFVDGEACSHFRIEPGPLGGFVISCECPV
jgi:hypothetical protein